MKPKDDSRCAHILRTVIRNLKEKEKEKVNESRAASSFSSQGYANQVYALRQKMFGIYIPSQKYKTDSRTASIVGELESSTEKAKQSI